MLIFAFIGCAFGIKAKCLQGWLPCPLRVHTGRRPRVRWCGWGIGGSQGPVAVICRWAHPQQLTGRLPDGSTMWLVGSVSLGYPLGCCSSSPWVAQHTPVFWMGQGRSGSLWQLPAHALTCLWEKSQARKVSWQWAVLPWGADDVDKVD